MARRTAAKKTPPVGTRASSKRRRPQREVEDDYDGDAVFLEDDELRKVDHNDGDSDEEARETAEQKRLRLGAVSWRQSV